MIGWLVLFRRCGREGGCGHGRGRSGRDRGGETSRLTMGWIVDGSGRTVVLLLERLSIYNYNSISDWLRIAAKNVPSRDFFGTCPYTPIRIPYRLISIYVALYIS